jgi:SAM-dependent methyltransferase
MDRRWYPEYADNWDSEIFRSKILPHLESSFRVLDLGAGAGNVPQMNFRGSVASVHGIDPSAQVRSNPFLDAGVVGVGERLPYAEASFDLVFSCFVLEHLRFPEETFRGVARVLRPGGVFLVLTPNRRHYLPVFARLSPVSIHKRVNRFRGRAPEHTFPTHYRANSRGDFENLARDARLDVVEIETYEGRPEYLRHLAITYPFGFAYERLVNATELLRGFRISILGVFRKPAPDVTGTAAS